MGVSQSDDTDSLRPQVGAKTYSDKGFISRFGVGAKRFFKLNLTLKELLFTLEIKLQCARRYLSLYGSTKQHFPRYTFQLEIQLRMY
jgi:hypothetical protein